MRHLSRISLGVAAMCSHCSYEGTWVCVCVLLFEFWQSVVIDIGGRKEDALECVVMAGITIFFLRMGYLL